MKKQFGCLLFHRRDNTHRHSDTPTLRHFELSFLRHSERSEESKNIKFFGIAENKAANYGFFGRVPLPLNDGRIAQLGRSMIEMLGVLAIVGVLSIGGIALYRRAVNHHQANSILDDANRFAFVITEKGGFPANAFIDNVQYERTSAYNLDAFVGSAGGQFGIVATDVPKGVCEPLIDKANIDYKVRVLPAGNADNVQQLAVMGALYDATQTDICNSGLNDVVLYFGDTSNQIPIDDDEPTQCTSNADCPAGGFCDFVGATETDKGIGECHSASSYGILTAKAGGHTYVRTTTGMYWDSAQDFCDALGMSTVSREDIGCGGITGVTDCTSDTVNALNGKWPYNWCWLEQHPRPGSGYTVNFEQKGVSSDGKIHKHVALCH